MQSLWRVLVLLMAFQAPVPVPRQAAKSHAGEYQHIQGDPKQDSDPAPKAASTVNRAQPQSDQGHADGDGSDQHPWVVRVQEMPPVATKDHSLSGSDWALIVFNALLVLVGAAQAFYVAKTLTAIHVQAALMKQQGDDAKSKERARIRITVSNVLLVDDIITDVACTVICDGPTPAFVEDAKAIGILAPSQDHKLLNVGLSMSLPPVLKESQQVERVHILQNGPITEVDLRNIDERKAFLFFYGHIRYTDVFGESRETVFRFLYEPSEFAFSDGSHLRRWREIGGSEANHAT